MAKRIVGLDPDINSKHDNTTRNAVERLAREMSEAITGNSQMKPYDTRDNGGGDWSVFIRLPDGTRFEFSCSIRRLEEE